jgi:hypothetical protein
VIFHAGHGAPGAGLMKNPWMSTNPYAPPLAQVETPRDEAGDPSFFAVAPWKLLLMCVVTLGLYQVYWFYANWRLVKRRERSGIWPAPRAIFGVFFCYSLFGRMRRFGEEQAVPEAASFAAGPLAGLWIVGTLTFRLPDAWGLIGIVTWFTLLPVQALVARINARVAPGADRNARLSWLNWISVVLGVLFLVLVLIGLLAPVAER